MDINLHGGYVLIDRLHPSDFLYLSEGGQYIVCKYIGKHKDLIGYVLKLVKIPYTDPSHFSKDTTYIVNVMAPYFNHMYFPMRKLVTMPSGFVTALSVAIEPYRAEGRRLHEGLVLQAEYGLLEMDLNKMHKSHSDIDGDMQGSIAPASGVTASDIMTVEIKVKCGLTCTSPFVYHHHSICKSDGDGYGDDDKHRAYIMLKQSHSQYTLMQLYKHAVTINVDYSIDCHSGDANVCKWGTFTCISSYCPNDIGSNSISDIERSIEELVKNPQNNLRISVNSDHIYGWGKEDYRGLQDQCNSFFTVTTNTAASSTPNSSNAGVASLVQVVSQMLAYDDIVKKIQVLQGLDVLGSDGAVILYDRLCMLLNGDDAKAMALVERSQLLPIDTNVLHVYSLYRQKLLDEVMNCRGKYSKEVDAFISLLSIQVRDTADGDMTGVHKYAEGISMVDTFDIDVCVYLLKLWLLALSCKDCSIMVNLKSFNRCSTSATTTTGSSGSDDSSRVRGTVTCKHLKGQTMKSTGVVLLHEHFSDDLIYQEEVTHIHYSITLIDVGSKPVRKIRSKYMKDVNACECIHQYQRKEVKQ